MRHCLLAVCLLFTSLSLFAQSEDDYIRALAGRMDGVIEHVVAGGRVDIVTDLYAIEVERADKWKNSIGQALWYGLKTGKRPGVILLAESSRDFRYFQMLNSALRYGGMEEQIKTWLYPNDFPGLEITANGRRYADPTARAKTDYWLTKSSKKRHTKKCHQYEESRGRYCSADEGTPAGCCH